MEASEHGANLPPLAHPRTHRGLPAEDVWSTADRAVRTTSVGSCT